MAVLYASDKGGALEPTGEKQDAVTDGAAGRLKIAACDAGRGVAGSLRAECDEARDENTHAADWSW